MPVGDFDVSSGVSSLLGAQDFTLAGYLGCVAPGAEANTPGAACVCVCESYIGKPIGTRAVPQFTTGVAKPLTQIEPGKTEHHPPV